MSPTATVTDTRTPETTSETEQPVAIKLNPYICLNGTVEKAIHLYETALGAKAEHIQRFGEVPGGSGPAATEHGNLIVHAAVRIGSGLVMFSDTTPDRPVPAESNVSVALDFTDLSEMEKAFAALGAGGKVVSPIEDSFWGAKFGMLTDAYGVSWMFNCYIKKG